MATLKRELGLFDVYAILLPGLAAMIRRRGQLVVPHDDTVIEQGDRLTILGSPRRIIDLRHRYDVHATTAPSWWRGRSPSREGRRDRSRKLR